MKTAKILVYEDIRGYYNLDTRIHKSLEGLNILGSNVVEVGDAVGDFMNNLNSATKWDLIIVGSENRSFIRGEFWDVLNEQVNKKVALVSEIWYLDQIANGRISTLMANCGLRFQKDWNRGSHDGNEYLLYLNDSSNPLFSYPYTLSAPLPTIYWDGDIGDFLTVAPGGEGQILMGTQPSMKSSYGVLGQCMEGRVLFQTFSTHDYRRDDTIRLWENMITYTLMNHYKAIDVK
jgi:hypothetical protein